MKSRLKIRLIINYIDSFIEIICNNVIMIYISFFILIYGINTDMINCLVKNEYNTFYYSALHNSVVTNDL